MDQDFLEIDRMFIPGLARKKIHALWEFLYYDKMKIFALTFFVKVKFEAFFIRSTLKWFF